MGTIKWVKQGCRIQGQYTKTVIVHTCNEQSENEIKEILFIIASKSIKSLRINLTGEKRTLWKL